MSLVNFLIVAALLAAVTTLALGLRSMSIGGEYDRTHSEKFMWERVALQAVIIVLLLATIVVGNT
ncbi:MAG: twin transmembrane helix small protein [Woeseiaceae bacterium]|nr:twin transmembrane helix small protein [Woeseiaceae bacterium]